MNKKAIILAILGAAVFYLLFRFIGTTNITPVLLNANPWIIGLSVFFQVLLMLCWAFRWELITNYMKIKVSFKRLFPYLLFINFGDIITPGPRFGSEPLVVYLMKKNDNVPADDTMASMLVERLYGLIVFNMLAIFSIFLLFAYVKVGFLHLSAWIMILVTVSLLIASGLMLFIIYILYTESKGLNFAMRFADKHMKFFYRLRGGHRGKKKESFEEFAQHTKKSIKMFFEDIIIMGKDTGLWTRGIFMSFVFYLIYFMHTFFAFAAVGIWKGFGFFAIVVMMMTLAELTGYLIMLPSAVGVTEVLMISILTSYGISLGQAAAGTLIARGIYYIFGLVSGYISLLWLEKSA